MTSLDGATIRLDALIASSGQHVNRAVRNASALVASLRTTRERLDLAFAAAQKLIEDGQGAIGNAGVGKTLASLNTLLRQGQRLLRESRDNLVDAAGYLRETGENMSDFSRRIREDPSLLLLGEGRD